MVTHPHPPALEAALRAAISDSDASDLAKRMNGGWSAQAALERAMRDAIPEAIVAYLAALQDTHALASLSDDDALRLSADIYDGMLSEPSSPRSKLLGSFEAKTELSAAPGAVGEIRDHLTALKAHTPGPWVFEGTRLIAAAPDLLEVAKAYERWEADLILDADAWKGRDLPAISQAIWDRLIEIQALRNAAIARAMIDAAPPAAQDPRP